MKQYIPILLLALALLSACKATKRAYEKGDYEKAVYNSIERLRKSPDNKKSLQTLAAAYPDLLAFYQDQIAIERNSGNQLRWERVMTYYETLNDIYNEVQRAPAARRALPNVRNFQSEYNSARRNAADARYVLGEERLILGKQGDRESAKEAFFHFEKANTLIRGFKDAESKMFESQSIATIIVEVEPIPMHSRTLSISNKFFENQMIEFFQGTNFNPFVRILSSREAQSFNREPDHIIRMIFDDFVVGQAYVKESELDRRKDDVVVGTVEVTKDSTADVLGTVEAKVHRFQKEISSSGLLDFRVIDARSGATVSQRKFPGTFIWYDRWGYYNGDKRALNDEDKDYMNKRRESPNPPPQDLFIEFTKPIFDQATRFVKDFYMTY